MSDIDKIGIFRTPYLDPSVRQKLYYIICKCQSLKALIFHIVLNTCIVLIILLPPHGKNKNNIRENQHEKKWKRVKSVTKIFFHAKIVYISWGSTFYLNCSVFQSYKSFPGVHHIQLGGKVTGKF